MDKYDYLIGQKINRWNIIGYDEEMTKKTGVPCMICKCECGTIRGVRVGELLANKSKSCGCIQKEIASNIMTKYNFKRNHIEYDFTLNCLLVYFNNYDGFFKCDLEDRDIVEKYCWYYCNGYAVASTKDENNIRHTIKFHRIVMKRKYGDIDNFQIDHKNHDTLDNRKDINLRLCSNGQNNMNARPRSSTGEKYIYYNKSRESYDVRIPNEPSVSFKNYWDAKEYKEKIIVKYPNEFQYCKEEDIMINNVISPFLIIDNDKFTRGN